MENSLTLDKNIFYKEERKILKFSNQSLHFIFKSHRKFTNFGGELVRLEIKSRVFEENAQSAYQVRHHSILPLSRIPF